MIRNIWIDLVKTIDERGEINGCMVVKLRLRCSGWKDNFTPIQVSLTENVKSNSY